MSDKRREFEEKLGRLKKASESDTKVERSPDRETQKEESDYEERYKRAQVDELLQNISERKIFSSRLYWLLVGWLIFVGVVMIAQGICSFFGKQCLSDKILIALLSATTVKVIGLFYLVIQYLFPKTK